MEGLEFGGGNKAGEAATLRSSHSPAPQIRPSAPSRVPESSLPRPSHIYVLSTHMHTYVHIHALHAHTHTHSLRRPHPSRFSLPRLPLLQAQDSCCAQAACRLSAPRPARPSILHPAQPQSSPSSRPIIVCDPAEHFQGKKITSFEFSSAQRQPSQVPASQGGRWLAWSPPADAPLLWGLCLSSSARCNAFGVRHNWVHLTRPSSADLPQSHGCGGSK